MATGILTKQQLLENMRATGRAFADGVRGLAPEDLAEGRYEEGWTAKDILAHVASIEWTYPRLLDVARGTIPLPRNDTSKSLPGDYSFQVGASSRNLPLHAKLTLN